ncbi:c-type cytochrome [Chitinophaga sp. GCM10012297]|uniref:C-type cytochrome n=1 Tax=Chitinophaga chungangae TaxID=2821488 RepID=A0ABS3YAF8_9BACT|nr:c-type cytochrome [Chitinophaga chungangae]MBO9151636.1 c-type cytochrome [Chitinophaga chungangae]
MKKFLKITVVIVLILIVGVAAVATYVKSALPDVGPAEVITIEKTPERIERGKYLANNVAVCMDCHSVRDWSQFAGPLVSESFGGGGERFGPEMGLPGTIYSRNITPHGISGWTDGELFRAITSGVSKDGSALFPLMPYRNYGKLDREDIYCIISYLRSLSPVKNDIAARSLDFPVNLIVNTIPQKSQFTPRPDTSDVKAYGKYLITAASCVECHSKSDKGTVIAGTEFGGGGEFLFPGGVVRSANLTPDATGIGSWSKEQFIRRFKLYADSTYQSLKVAPTDFNTPMPWVMYAKMTEQDLGAIYEFLRTLKPISHQVTKFEKRSGS